MNALTLNVGDNVNVTIKSIDATGIIVTMDDYNQTEGFVPLSEAVPRNTKYYVGEQHTAKIIRMSHPYYDLSFKLKPKSRAVLQVQEVMLED